MPPPTICAPAAPRRRRRWYLEGQLVDKRSDGSCRVTRARLGAGAKEETFIVKSFRLTALEDECMHTSVRGARGRVRVREGGLGGGAWGPTHGV